MDNENKIGKPTVQANNDSIAVGYISMRGNIGDIHIGHTTGYTVEEVSTLITQITATFQAKPFDGRYSYKGLNVFEHEDAELFFGREKLVDDLVSRVKDSRTVFVTGPSGSGKSSLVRVGLIHTLKQGAVKDLHGERWLYGTMKPGRDSLAKLARVTAGLAGSTDAEDEVCVKALTDATFFARWCEIALKDGRNKRAVLFIDQFEQVFMQIIRDAERIAFLKLLTHAATFENGYVIILFSMRSDFVSNCVTYPQLNALLNQQFAQIGAMQPDELVSAIAQPALRVGLQIDPDLSAQILNDMKVEPGALPLMQFALKDLFDAQQSKGGVIAPTLNDYLGRNGIHKALERHADGSFAKLDQHGQELTRSIFSGLIEIGRGTHDTRRTALFNELIPASTKAEEVQAIVQKLADARLITTDEAAGNDTVTISHEKWIDAWPWLKKLVNENRNVITLQNEIDNAAKEWEDHQRDASYLHTGAQLAKAREPLNAKKLILSGMASEFVQAGRTRQRRGQKAVIGGVSIIIVLQIDAVIIFAGLTKESRKQTPIDPARKLAAQAQSINATTNSKQMPAVLLAIQSMQMFPSAEASQVLQNNSIVYPIAYVSHENAVNSVTFSSNEIYVASGSRDNTARVWDAIAGKEIARMTRDGSVNSVTFSPDSKYVVSRAGNTVRVREAATGNKIPRMTHDGATTGKEVAELPLYWGMYSVASGPDEKYVVSRSGWDTTAYVSEAITGTEFSRMTHDGGVTSVAFSPYGKYVATGSLDNTARVRENAPGKDVTRLTFDGEVDSVAFSPDGKYVFSGSVDKTAHVWI